MASGICAGACVKVASRVGRFMTLADAGKLEITVALYKASLLQLLI